MVMAILNNTRTTRIVWMGKFCVSLEAEETMKAPLGGGGPFFFLNLVAWMHNYA